VHLPGRVGNLGDWYERATLYTLTSRFEGFPNTLIEAMSYGLPVISMNCPDGPADIIIHGENGILSDSYDDLRQSLIDLMNSPEMRERLATTAIKIRQILSVDSISTQWLDLFQKLIWTDFHQSASDNSEITEISQ
jgi:glycosyltransferase involved in cell wall biosynthesis